MHYIEVFDENMNMIKKYSFFPEQISKVFAKIKSLNSEKKKFKHYFID
tara:strand:+ start:420 stop:563 length:144 start_codon:yes stop_codon:yes gene_type:complete